MRGFSQKRFLPVDYFTSSFAKNAGKLQKLTEKYPELDIVCLDNSKNNGGNIISVEQAKEKFDYEVTDKKFEKLYEIFNDYKNGTNKTGYNTDGRRIEEHQAAIITGGLSETEAFRIRRPVVARRNRENLEGTVLRGSEYDGERGSEALGSVHERPVKNQPQSTDEYSDEDLSQFHELKNLLEELDDEKDTRFSIADTSIDVVRNTATRFAIDNATNDKIRLAGLKAAKVLIPRSNGNFMDFAQNMVDIFGERVKPYIKMIWGAAYMDEDFDQWADRMTPVSDVRKFDISTIKPNEKPVKRSAAVQTESAADFEAIKLERNVKTDVEPAYTPTDTSVDVVKKAAAKAQRDKAKKEKTNQYTGMASLFDEEPINQQNNGNNNLQHGENRQDGDTSREGTSANSDGQMGRSEQPQVQQPEQRGVDKGSSSSGVNGGIRGGGLSEQTSGSVQPLKRKNTRNFHDKRGVNYTPSNVRERIVANVEAIRLLKKLESEGRTATKAEQEVLRRFSGWGGLGSAFDYYSP